MSVSVCFFFLHSNSSLGRFFSPSLLAGCTFCHLFSHGLFFFSSHLSIERLSIKRQFQAKLVSKFLFLSPQPNKGLNSSERYTIIHVFIPHANDPQHLFDLTWFVINMVDELNATVRVLFPTIFEWSRNDSRIMGSLNGVLVAILWWVDATYAYIHNIAINNNRCVKCKTIQVTHLFILFPRNSNS